MVSFRALLALPVIIPVVSANVNLAECNAVNMVVDVLKLYKATPFCSSFIHLPTSTVLSVVPATTTTTVVTTASTETDLTTQTSITLTTVIAGTTTTVVTAGTATTQAPAKRDVQLPSFLIQFASSAISTACSCLSIPLTVTTRTSASTTVKIATSSVTATTLATITTVVPSTVLSTVVATFTFTPAPAVVNPSCDHPGVCGSFQLDCNASGNCGICLNSANHGAICVSDGGCDLPCTADSDCASGSFCAQDTCCGNVCATLDYENPCGGSWLGKRFLVSSFEQMAAEAGAVEKRDKCTVGYCPAKSHIDVKPVVVSHA